MKRPLIKKNEIYFDVRMTEPVSSVRPKFNEGDEYKMVRGRAQSSIRMLCNAQSSPAPISR